MATFLHRLGRFAFGHRWAVAAGWVMLLVVAVVGAGATDEEPVESFDIPGTESSEAMALLDERFPAMAADGATGRIVFAAPDGGAVTDLGNARAIASVISEVEQLPTLAHVSDPFETDAEAVSPGGDVAYAEVTFESSVITAEEQAALLDVADSGRDAGLVVEIGGDVAEPEMEEGAIGELIGFAIAAVVLVITFGSFVAAGLPLLNAIVGVGLTLSAITVATRFIDLSEDASILALMLGLALAIDYSLFITSRYRHELSTGLDGREAAGRAVGTAGNAVVFAGLTVVIALVGLSVVGIPVLTQMGLAAALAVVFAVVTALTMLPAMFAFVGGRILGGRLPRFPNRNGKTVGLSWARMVTRHPLRVLVVAFVGVGAMTIPAMSMELGMPDDGSFAEDTTQRQAYDLVTDGFGPGFNGPLTVVVDAADGEHAEDALPQAVDAIDGLDGVLLAEPAAVDQTGETGIISVVPQTGPGAEETKDLVGDIRDLSGEVEDRSGAAVSVTGPTAVTIDFSQKMGDALVPYLAVVVGLSFVLMILVFRSILVPLKAALGFLMTMGATFGATVAVFQWGWLTGLLGVDQTGPIISLLPVVLIGVLFGLAMDYQVFLVTRMREEYVHGMAAVEAVVAGFGHSARVVTAAAIIMISVFAGFIFAHEPMIKQIGFALAIAVALDAFVVRMAIVPAVMALLGRAAWWLPRWLDRILPDVDVEGERLTRRLEAEARDQQPVQAP